MKSKIILHLRHQKEARFPEAKKKTHLQENLKRKTSKIIAIQDKVDLQKFIARLQEEG